MKAQWIRLADVFAIGPLMVWGGWEWRKTRPWLGFTLALLGISTVVYNGHNYLIARRVK